jgi:hypothetical protein
MIPFSVANGAEAFQEKNKNKGQTATAADGSTASVPAPAPLGLTAAAAAAAAAAPTPAHVSMAAASSSSFPVAATPKLEVAETAAAGGSNVSAVAPISRAPAAGSSAPASTSRQAAHLELLQHMRAVSDHVVRAGEAFDSNFPGQLVTEWQDEATKYQFAISVVWAYDEASAEVRTRNLQLSGEHKRMPLLPMITVGVVGDGTCLLQSMLLADAHPDPTRNIPPQEDRAIVVAARRDSVFGRLAGKIERDAVATVLRKYRTRSVRSRAHPPPALPHALGTHVG